MTRRHFVIVGASDAKAAHDTVETHGPIVASKLTHSPAREAVYGAVEVVFAGLPVVRPPRERVHVLRTDADPFDAIESGLKTWEFRLNDRDFRVGDVLELVRSPGPRDSVVGADGRRRITYLQMRVTYLLPGGRYGIPEGYCIMSIVPIEVTSGACQSSPIT